MGVAEVGLSDGTYRKVGCGIGEHADDFTGPNGLLDPPWVVLGYGGGTGVIRNSNQAATGWASSTAQNLAVVNIGSPDMDAQVTIAVGGNIDDMGLAYRHRGTVGAGSVFTPGTGAVAYDPGGYLIHYRPDGSFTGLVPAAPGDVVKVEARGTSVTVYQNGVVIDSATTALPDAGDTYVGVYFEFLNNLGRLDDFSASRVGMAFLGLSDGTYVRERCDGDLATARPLLLGLEDGTYTQVACMVPA